MEQTQYNTKQVKHEHINYADRIRIEALFKQKLSPIDIGKSLRISKSRRTVERELRSGIITQLKTVYDLYGFKHQKKFCSYSAEVGQANHDLACTRKGARLKIGSDYALMDYIEHCIGVERLSPYAAAQQIKQNTGF